MIVQRDLKNLSQLIDFSCDQEILFGGFGFVTGVVVGHNEGTCVAQDQSAKDIAGMDEAVVCCSAKYHLCFNHF